MNKKYKGTPDNLSSGDQNIKWHNHSVTREQREAVKKQSGVCLWFTGLSGSGKSTLANILESRLNTQGYHTYLLDGDNIRHGLNSNLGFTSEERTENIRRIGEVAKLFVDAGIIVITAFISPFTADRKKIRDILPENRFIEIFVKVDLKVCESRDPKGLYTKAREGKIKNFTGISSPYEPPLSPEIIVENSNDSVPEESAKIIEDYLRLKGFIC